jgi:ribosome-associated translation inhibitor RaiA
MDLICHLATPCLNIHGGKTMIDELFAQRVFERIDKFDDKIDDLCDRMMKVELDVTNHLTTVEQNSNRKEKRFYVLIASMGTIFAAVSLFQSIN